MSRIIWPQGNCATGCCAIALGECFRDELHGYQVTRRKSAHIGEGFLQVGGEAIDDSGTPGGLFLPCQDDFPGVSVGFDDDGIGRQDGTDTATAEMGLDFLKCGGVALGQRRRRRYGRKDGLRPSAATGKARLVWFFRVGFAWFIALMTSGTRRIRIMRRKKSYREFAEGFLKYQRVSFFKRQTTPSFHRSVGN